jgi:type II secretory ATPase GspE/PulE/Tfp pilus assembly ATPase PilB-like protein
MPCSPSSRSGSRASCAAAAARRIRPRPKSSTSWPPSTTTRRTTAIPGGPSAISSWRSGRRPSARCGLHRAKGCSQCKDTGYSGRLGVYEVLVGDDKVRHAIRAQAAAGVIQAAALAAGMLTLRQDGILKVLQGHTDIREIRATCV